MAETAKARVVVEAEAPVDLRGAKVSQLLSRVLRRSFISCLVQHTFCTCV